FLIKLRDDKSLAGLLELAEFVADLNEDEALGFVQSVSRLLDGPVFFGELVLLSPPVKDLPLHHHAYTGRVLWDHLVEIPEGHVGEAEAHVGDVFGLLNAPVYFGLLDPQSRRPHFGPLL